MGEFANNLISNIPVVGQVASSVLANSQNMKIAKYAYSKDLEMWNRNNEYNNPQSQMQRLKTAGLSPNLVYGNGVTGNSGSQLPKFQAPTMSYDMNLQNPLNNLSLFQDIAVKQAQIDNIKQQTQNGITENALKAISLEWLPAEKQQAYGTKGIGQDLAGQKLQQEKNKTWLSDSTKNTLKQITDQKLARESETVKSMVLQNAIKQLELNWFKADKWIGIGSKAVNALGIAGIAKGLFSGKKPELKMPSKPTWNNVPSWRQPKFEPNKRDFK